MKEIQVKGHQAGGHFVKPHLRYSILTGHGYEKSPIKNKNSHMYHKLDSGDLMMVKKKTGEWAHYSNEKGHVKSGEGHELESYLKGKLEKSDDIRYVLLVRKAVKDPEEQEEKEPKKKPKKEPEEEPEEKQEEGNESDTEVGHVIMVPDSDKKVDVTAVGQHGVTARDEKGNKYQILHEHVEKDGNSKNENEKNGKNKKDENKGDDEESLDSNLPKKGDKKGVGELGGEGKEEKFKTVKDFLKKYKPQEGDWVQATAIAKHSGIDRKIVKKELKKMELEGDIQYVNENKWGDVLYKWTGAHRAEHEGKTIGESLKADKEKREKKALKEEEDQRQGKDKKSKENKEKKDDEKRD